MRFSYPSISLPLSVHLSPCPSLSLSLPLSSLFPFYLTLSFSFPSSLSFPPSSEPSFPNLSLLSIPFFLSSLFSPSLPLFPPLSLFSLAKRLVNILKETKRSNERKGLKQSAPTAQWIGAEEKNENEHGAVSGENNGVSEWVPSGGGDQ